ncbi:hypothetical protein GALMADRAFT_250368 [Galerina marginata CBS 339.88]|uniref:MYND-type domain-containing protein n=1 Tax=Galerina marginata (strain CBS 339.88) TaxID=685588 RepID=A0A067SU66_GALM3|nr:hypothetical protein GALMADRAFT_250368 [Galerina marginata CBS 339.88]
MNIKNLQRAPTVREFHDRWSVTRPVLGCKVLPYCSRECQKNDWPEHKLVCSDPEVQSNYVRKYIARIHGDQGFLPFIRLALLAELYHKFTSANPQPQKVCVVRAVMSIQPRDATHLKALEDIDIPLTSLFGKEMMGSFLFIDVVDISNTTVHPLDDRSKAIWQAHRDEINKEGHLDAHVVLAKFDYWNQTVLMVPFAVSSLDLEDHSAGGLENPKMLRELNAAINREALEGTNLKKRLCVLGDNDKKHVRIHAVARKVWEAKHGRKAPSCV